MVTGDVFRGFLQKNLPYHRTHGYAPPLVNSHDSRVRSLPQLPTDEPPCQNGHSSSPFRKKSNASTEKVAQGFLRANLPQEYGPPDPHNPLPSLPWR